MNEYLAQLESSNVRSLQGLVDWNLSHAEEALPAGPSLSLRIFAIILILTVYF
jgi:hypothetical protein